MFLSEHLLSLEGNKNSIIYRSSFVKSFFGSDFGIRSVSRSYAQNLFGLSLIPGPIVVAIEQERTY